MPYSPTPHDVSHPVIVAQADVPFACRKNCTNVIEAPAISAVCQIVRRIIEIHVVARPAVEETPDVERCSHGHTAGYFIGVAKGKVQSLIAAKTTTCSRQTR